jgi:putative isomerase
MAEISTYIGIIREHLHRDYKGMLRDPAGACKYPFLTPGSEHYQNVLWDWDAWSANIALKQIVHDIGDADEIGRALPYERGCVENYLHYGHFDGWLPGTIKPDKDIEAMRPSRFDKNMRKPTLAQHAAFITKYDNDDAEWIRDGFYYMQSFLHNYRTFRRHKCGLYMWQSEGNVGVDNDPCSYYRPPNSCGSIYLNCFMYREMLAMEYLADCLNQDQIGAYFRREADELREAVIAECWDEKDGFFYSVDLNLVEDEAMDYSRRGMGRPYDSLIMRIGVWSGFMALWCELATPEQAERVVKENYRDDRTFNAAYGVRTLSKLEKMYSVVASGCPSNWWGPIWGICNYLTFRGLLKYGFTDDATELAEKTIRLYGRDFERFGALHEYYDPDNGEPILNKGFQNWNFLVINMINWLEGKEPIEEF